MFPKAAVQLCIVHLVRRSLNDVSWKMRNRVAADLKKIHACATVERADQRQAEFEQQ